MVKARLNNHPSRYPPIGSISSCLVRCLSLKKNSVVRCTLHRAQESTSSFSQSCSTQPGTRTHSSSFDGPGLSPSFEARSLSVPCVGCCQRFLSVPLVAEPWFAFPAIGFVGDLELGPECCHFISCGPFCLAGVCLDV